MHTGEKYELQRLPLIFARKQKATKLNGLFTENGEQKMLEEKEQHALNMSSPFIASLVNIGLCFEKRSERTRMNVQYDEIFNKILADCEEQAG